MSDDDYSNDSNASYEYSNDDDDDEGRYDDDFTRGTVFEAERDNGQMVQLIVYGFYSACLVLFDADEYGDGRPIQELIINIDETLWRRGLFYGGTGVRDDAPDFRRFVTLLGQGFGGSGRVVHNITFKEGWSYLPQNDLERLFRDVLPNHPTLQGIHIDMCGLDVQYVRMLTENVQVLSNELRLGDSGDFDPDKQEQVVQAIINMLRRSNVRIAGLYLHLDLEEHQCRRICHELRGNGGGAHVLHLQVRAKDIWANTLHGAAALTSLQGLRVTGRFAEDAVASLTAQLRANVSLQVLQIIDTGPNRETSEQEVLAFVRTYNYTLRAAYVLRWARMGSLGTTPTEQADLLEAYRFFLMPYDVPVEDQLPIYMCRNQRIRMALDKLQQQQPVPAPGSTATSSSSLLLSSSEHPRLIPKRLLPELTCLVNDLPTVLYRVLKMGYGVDVSDCILAKLNEGDGDGGGRLRRRRRRVDYLMG